MYKGILVFCAALIMAVGFGITVQAENILFENRVQQRLSRGVVYERNRMMTTNGMLDVHVMLVDLNEQYLNVEPVTSSLTLGRRDTTSNILADAGAIGGINADFFGMAGAYSIHFGPMAIDGELLGLSVATNYHRNEFATFLLDMQNNVDFVYMQSDIHFYNNGVRNVTDINAFNNIGHDLYWPVIVDRGAMENTVALDRRFDWLTKIVVENGVITFVSMPGENVDVPESGYVLILPERMHGTHRHLFRMGDAAQLTFRNNRNVDFSRMQSAIGGGGLILSRGQLVADSGVAPGSRHPRTAVGVNNATGQLILMTVDGRSHSVGATHAEMANILRRYGATDAMHMDGGGSTTMATRSPDGRVAVANTPSDGGQRRVINALGVFDRAPIGDKVRLALEMEETHAVVGAPIAGRVFGEDNLSNRLELDPSVYTVFLVEDTDGGTWRDGRFTPLRTGRHNLEVRRGGYSATATVYAYELAELQIRPESISVLDGDRVAINFSGITVDGAPIPVPGVASLSVSPSYLGTFDGDEFVAVQAGVGYISAVVGSVRAYIPVSVGGFASQLNMFGTGQRFSSSPDYVIGNTRADNLLGRRVARLEYLLVNSPSTQAAYLNFYPAIDIPGAPIALRLQVYGDGPGHWLRGRVRDGSGAFHNVDFAHSVDFVGWETTVARMPDAPGPFSIDRIYMVTLGSSYVSHHMVGFYGLEALYSPENRAAIPQSTLFRDRLRAEPGFAGAGTSFQFAVPAASAGYSATQQGDFAVVNIMATGGGIATADRNQWARFMRDIRNMNRDYVVILMDANPFGFSQRMEFELFHGAMQELLGEGMLVFVVSATGAAGEPATLTMRDGIRYVNLARRDGAAIRFWADNERIWWSE